MKLNEYIQKCIEDINKCSKDFQSIIIVNFEIKNYPRWIMDDNNPCTGKWEIFVADPQDEGANILKFSVEIKLE